MGWNDLVLKLSLPKFIIVMLNVSSDTTKILDSCALGKGGLKALRITLVEKGAHDLELSENSFLI